VAVDDPVGGSWYSQVGLVSFRRGLSSGYPISQFGSPAHIANELGYRPDCPVVGPSQDFRDAVESLTQAAGKLRLGHTGLFEFSNDKIKSLSLRPRSHIRERLRRHALAFYGLRQKSSL
jgi:hypothetical protein